MKVISGSGVAKDGIVYYGTLYRWKEIKSYKWYDNILFVKLPRKEDRRKLKIKSMDKTAVDYIISSHVEYK